MSSDSIKQPPTHSRESAVAIHIESLSKQFAVYHSPIERLKHIIAPSRRKGWSKFRALDDINLTIARGETCAIVGRNGSGKSTLLQILCGTLQGTAGRVEVNGRVAALLELGAGFNSDFTGRENVYMNGAVLGLSRSEIETRFSDIEAFAEIGDFIDQPVKTYSSGMYVRLAFAVAIHVDPQILIVDEALAVGDSRFQAKCMKRIKSMQADGVTILFVSHDVGAVRTLCDRALWLDHGRVRMLGDAFSVTAQYNQFLFENDGEETDGENRNSKIDPRFAGASEPNMTADEPKTIAQDSDALDVVANAISDKVHDAIDLMAKHRPINHWGSHVGSILEAGIFNARGERATNIMAREDIEVRIRISPPATADRSTLSVAFSLKDLRGTDLIVSTTWDQQSLDFTKVGATALVRFVLKNRLNAGNYLLAVALEDRASIMPQYYEYIEGAHYFTSLTENKLYGTFVAEVEQIMDAECAAPRVMA